MQQLHKNHIRAKHSNRHWRLVYILIACAMVYGCGPTGVGNVRSTFPEGRWIAGAEPKPETKNSLVKTQSRQATDSHDALLRVNLPDRNLRITPMKPLQKEIVIPQPWALQSPPLSPGDRLRITIQDGEEFSGIYELDMDGSIKLPYLPPVQAAGNSINSLRKSISDALVYAGFFRAGLINLDVSVQEWSQVQVNVTGAVFQPGLVTVNVRKAEERALRVSQQSGDYPLDRMLPAALRVAGGVRPDANVSEVILIRNGVMREINLRGLLAGEPVEPLPLMSADTIFVPSTGKFDEALVRPSAMTPPGVRIFLSNLTVPAPDNSKSAISEHATSVPYGTRMLTALISANCVGGTTATNSSRSGVLVTVNPISGETEIIERSIEEILRNPERKELNPHVMPNDGIACYDSGVSNLRDIGRTFRDILFPLWFGL